MEPIEAAKRSRVVAFTQLTRMAEKIELHGNEWTEIQISIHLSLLESYLTKFEVIQKSIEEEGDNTEVEHRNKFEDIYISLKSKLLTLKSGFQTNSASLCATNSNGHGSGTLKSKSVLPSIQLQKFDGNYAKWCDFINMFNTLIDENVELTSIEKLQMLRSSLSGTAATVIQSLECSDENYHKALELLKARYNNKRLIFSSHISNLISTSSVVKGSVHHLRELVDYVNGEMRALQSLGSKEQIAEAMLINIISSKLDYTTRSKWEEAAPLNEIPKWKEFLDFLQRRCQTMEHVQSLNHPQSHQPTRKRDNSGKLIAIVSSNPSGKTCFLCHNAEHALYKCPQFIKLSTKERYNITKKFKLCINCLKSGHMLKACKSSSCVKCSQRHHTSLHFSAQNLPVTNKSQLESCQNQKETLQDNQMKLNCLSSSHKENSTSIIIATAIVNAVSQDGLRIPCRILLDSASQSHFITQRLAQQLNLKKEKTFISIIGIGSSECQVKHKVYVTIESLHMQARFELESLVLPNITTEQPTNYIDISSWNIPQNVPLADPLFNQPNRIDLLVGAEVFMKLLCIGQISLGTNQPTLQKSVFGWLVSGKAQTNSESSDTRKKSTYLVSQAFEINKLNDTIKRFWELENIENKTKCFSTEETECEKHFQQNTFRNAEGRFIVRLPFKESPLKLGTSKIVAQQRLEYLKTKFKKNPEIKAQYHAFMKEYEDLNHMETYDQTDSNTYYMPHHGVEQLSSTSTKLRVVFDASCKTSSGKSLNDILMIGPVVQDDLFSILCRFRIHTYVLTADIIKMYRQILIHPNDRHYQLILWENSDSNITQTFRLNTVTYGTASAPYLATKCLNRLSEEYEFEFPIGAKVLRNDFYVDDLLTGANTTTELNEIRSQLSTILHKAGMSLHKWCTNSKDMIQQVTPEHRQRFITIDDDQTTKTLGMRWQPFKDQFFFESSERSHSQKITKRTVLSTIASLFDPLGLINPVTVLAKILMQDLWKLKLSWDESLPANIHSKWTKFLLQLKIINKIKIPRHVMVPKTVEAQLHGFSDASQAAYGACIFLRVIDECARAKVTLLCAKSRVAPVKAQTIPRLELCAMVLLSELVDKVITALRIKLSSVYCWTDSTVALAWISSSPSKWSVFVSHRVSKIQLKSELHSIKWKHIHSEYNPADILSRGAFPDQLMQNNLWFSGPEFLSSPETTWPLTKSVESTSIERKKNTTLLTTSNRIDDIIASSKFIGSYQTIIRVFAYVNRFIKKCRRQSACNSQIKLDLPELKDGEIIILRTIQRLNYNKEIEELKKGNTVNKMSSIISLNPFIDSDGIIRVGGRLTNAEINFDAKHPILLPRAHPFTKCLVHHLHEKHLHVGCLTLHAIIRQRYWIPNARQLIRSTMHRCVKCFRFRPTTLEQIMGHLPHNRVNSAHPFANTGVDYGGPFTIKNFGRGMSTLKAYIALFICFSTKAVHLELVSNLSTEAFISCLKRFVSRRGRCHTITSDNATNFVGAKNELLELKRLFCSQPHNDLVEQYCQNEGIQWQFIPPKSPHFGGLWEASIKKAKSYITKLLQTSRLNFEEFNTIIIQIEGILNSRPLTPMSTDPNDLEALTPAHFLIGRPLLSIPEPDLTDIKLNHLSRWQYICRLQQSFWTRWSKEYLATLQQRPKWRFPTENISIGSMVLLKEDNLPPNVWALGRVVHIVKGSDGHVRVADVKTSKGIFRRAITKLCRLPIEDNKTDVEVPSRRGEC